MTLEEETLLQRVSAVLSVYPECRHSDGALVFRVLMLYGASAKMGSEESMRLPDPVHIIAVARSL
jgi:hypothetical protein